MKTKILIIEDEKDLQDVLTYNFKKEGYDVASALNGAEGFSHLKDGHLPDIVLLDLMLPDMSGTDICRQIRANKDTKDIPVLMLTAKSEEMDRVAGFEVGADDYVTKPFSVRELILRVKSLLKRTASGDKTEHENVEFGVLKIDIPGHRVYVDRDEKQLTVLEFNLLITLFERRGRVQSRDVLLSDVWDINADVTTRTVDTHVKRLREKLGLAGSYIETVRGVGYRFIKNLLES
ncbi:MAG: response regulator transcription factor [Deltaproteobacteria bacterium]|nr:response regulator transcription factor [Deltaproteobacteria bacterium]